MFLRLPTRYILLITLLLLARIGVAQTDPIERKWYVDDKTAIIEIFRAPDNTYFGKVVWLKRRTLNGKEKIDIHNPDTSKRRQTLLGLTVLKGFKKIKEDEYDGGTIYDPKNGKSYSCKMICAGDKLHVRGYIGFSLFGKSTVWTKAD